MNIGGPPSCLNILPLFLASAAGLSQRELRQQAAGSHCTCIYIYIERNIALHYITLLFFRVGSTPPARRSGVKTVPLVAPGLLGLSYWRKSLLLPSSLGCYQRLVPPSERWSRPASSPQLQQLLQVGRKLAVWLGTCW